MYEYMHIALMYIAKKSDDIVMKKSIKLFDE